MEYPLEPRDLEVITEIEQEYTALLNKEVNSYLVSIIRKQKLPPQPFGYGFDETKTKLIPAPKP